ncbi:LlsX family protein [Streptomyces sp. NPDC093109]|uniref:LlsX family protein n=1 Tax=Streptomyces sp. NPDC093109 TaxID=3154977 RepID=UPI00344B68DD
MVKDIRRGASVGLILSLILCGVMVFAASQGVHSSESGTKTSTFLGLPFFTVIKEVGAEGSSVSMSAESGVIGALVVLPLVFVGVALLRTARRRRD